MNSSQHRQGYLDSPPTGINARNCWKIKGGQGEGSVKFIDIQQGWILDHKNYSVNVLPATGLNIRSSREHGAAVLGVILMNGKETDAVGITPKVTGHVISTWRPSGTLNIPEAISVASEYLSQGDVLLLTIQRYLSAEIANGLPVEIHEGVFDAIRSAVDSGIIVIESAGNGEFDLKAGIDLDSFELDGRNVFNRQTKDFKDSGAILVGAATASIPHKRISYSNYGSRVDCYAWGEKVLTAGSFPISSGPSLISITENFCGTSSAAAIIAGAAIAIQSICEANLGFRLSPHKMREILSNETYGTLSSNGREVDKIGVMPDLIKIANEEFNCAHV
jgi:hypothetical protein